LKRRRKKHKTKSAISRPFVDPAAPATLNNHHHQRSYFRFMLRISSSF
jgi:hypothetical protein